MASAADQLELVEIGGGTRLRLRVKPRGRENAVLGVHGGALKVAIAAAPERGKANRAVSKFLGRLLDLPPTEVRILSGTGSQDKAVLVPLSPADVSARLGPLL